MGSILGSPIFGNTHLLSARLAQVRREHEPMYAGLAGALRRGRPTLEGHGTSGETLWFPLKGSFKGNIGPYKGDVKLFLQYLDALGTTYN